MEASIPSWRSQSFVAEWAGEDVLADMLALPRRISAAIVADSGSTPTHVVDVGSGPGSYLRIFLNAFPYARGTWTDTSPPMEPLGRSVTRGLSQEPRRSLEREARYGDEQRQHAAERERSKPGAA